MKPEQLGPYRIVRQLGRGGMGIVYEGLNVQTGEPAAVKVLSLALGQDRDFRQRFEAEVEALRKLNHPNIVRLFGFGEQEDHLFYAMELIDGTSLDEVLKHGQHFDWRQTIRIGIEIARALRHAHDRGIIHRDIKPANLLMAAEGHFKLSDFGIARLFGSTKLTSPGSTIGTVEYMAPEQADGRPVDPRSDLYSLGVVLYALLAGRPPFQAGSVVEMLQKHRYDAPDPLRRYAPDVPAELESIIYQLLEKEPADRIANASVLGRRLEALWHALTQQGPEAESEEHRDFEVTSPQSAPAKPASQDLPMTRAWDESSDVSPINAVPPLPAARDTAAFDHLKRAPVKPVPPEPPAKPASFVLVKEGELDRIPSAPEEHHPLISLQTWVLIAAIAAVGAGVRYMLQPPSADALYRRIAAHAASGTLTDARTDIDVFLDRYPRDPRCDQVRQYDRDAELDRLEWKLEHPLAGLIKGRDPLPIERDYLEAIQYLTLAPERAAAKLRAIVDFYTQDADRSGPTGQYLELARRKLAQLDKKLQDRASAQVGLIRQRINDAKRRIEKDSAGARAILLATIELYGNKPWAAALVDDAKATLAAMDKQQATDKNKGKDHAP